MPAKQRKSILLFETELSWFVLVGVLDAVLTWLMLRYSAEGRTRGLRFVEGNPIAQFVLRNWGMTGMLVFKLIMTALVCVIAEFVGRYRKELGRNILRLGTLIVGAVVIYSFLLLTGNMHFPRLDPILRFFR